MRNRISAIALIVMISLGVRPLSAGQARTRISSYVFNETDIENVEAEIAFGRELAARIVGNYPLVGNSRVNRYVATVAQGVALYSSRPELKYHVGIIDSDAINAFAAPGGYIFITRGALLAMNNEAQLAAVIGHEIAHIQERHVLKEIQFRGPDKSLAAGLGNLIGASTSTLRVALDQAINQAANILFKKGYKVKDEIEADRIGVLMASVAGYSPVALKTFLQKVDQFETTQTKSEGEHPLHEVRIKKIDETLKENGLLLFQQVKLGERFHENVRANDF